MSMRMTPEVPEPGQAPLPPAAARWLAHAREQADCGGLRSARRSLQRALTLAPGHVEVLRALGRLAFQLRDYAGGIEAYRSILAVQPDDARAHLQLGIGLGLSRRGAVDEALEHTRRACELDPRHATAWFELGRMLVDAHRHDAAADALGRALDADPAHVPARMLLAQVQIGLGAIASGAASYREVLRHEPGNALAWLWLSDIDTVRFGAADVAQLERALDNASLSEEARDELAFALAKAIEQQGDYARAFDMYQRVNASRRKRVSWNAATERERVQAIMRAYARPLPAPVDAELGREVIFIVSMPRAGSTLVERILSSHPEVTAANEIQTLRLMINAESERRGSAFPAWVPAANARDWQRLGEEYLARTAVWRENTPRFTDKSLINWYLVGTALTMLPAMRVVLVQRDPVETCLACFRQYFGGEAGFTCDLDEMADYCIDFTRLASFWMGKFPGRILDFRYETLVAEPEASIRRLLDFCGLPFDPRCLDFHKTQGTGVAGPSASQVREPLRRDTRRSERYGSKLDHLRQRLRDAGVSA